MITKHKHKKLTWVDVLSPSSEEVTKIMKDYKIDDLLADELLLPTQRDRIDIYQNFIFMVLHFPKSAPQGEQESEHEIDFILGKDFLVTVHYSQISPILAFAKMLETNSILKKNESRHAGFLFFHLILEFYRQSADKILDIGRDLKIIEKNIFAGREGEMVEALSHVNRKLIDYRQATHTQADILKTLEIIGVNFYGQDFQHYLRAISSEYNKTQNFSDNQKSILNDLRETNDSLLSKKTNRVIQILTIITVISIPLAVVPQIFGMNIDNMPIAGSPSGFWKIIVLILAISSLTLYYFKKKKWL